MTASHAIPVHFHAGHNDAGYLPESDVATFSTFEDAKAYMIAELLQAADHIASWSDEHECDDIPCPTFGDECPDQLANAAALEAETLNLESGPAWDAYLSDGRSLPVHWWIQPCSEDCHDEDGDDCPCSDCSAPTLAESMLDELDGIPAYADDPPVTRDVWEGSARRLASEWHGGQWSALYAFSSSGHVSQSLRDEVEREVTDDTDRAALLAYLDATHPTFSHPYSGEVTVTGNAREDIAAVVRLDHPCDDPSCDIAAMLDNGFPFAAAHSLLSATDAEVTAEVVGWYGPEVTGSNLYDCEDWPGWKAHHDAYGVRCEDCGGFTYGDRDGTPEECGSCGATLPGEPAPDFWGLLESPPAGCSEVAAMWSWSQNYDAGKGPAVLFCDLIGYSEDEHGESFSTPGPLGFVEVEHLRDALSDYLADPSGVRAFVGQLLEAEVSR